MSFIDTEVKGNAESLRATARWLRDSLAREVSEAAQVMTAARNAADAGWDGVAGDAFSSRMKSSVTKADELASLMRKYAGGFDDLANKLQQAQAQAAHVRDAAKKAGVAVVNYFIKEPQPNDPDYKTRIVAYNDAKAARNAVTTIENLYISTGQNMLKDLKEKWFFVVSDLASGLSEDVIEARVSKLHAKATGLTNLADTMTTARDSLPPGSPLRQVLDLRNASETATRKSAEALTQASKAAKFAKAAKAGGAGLAIGGVLYDHYGPDKKGWDQSITSGAASFGASVAVGAGTGALVGSFVPVAGTAVGGVVGTIVGAGAGIFTSGMVDSLWDSHGDVGHAAMDGFRAIGDTGSTIGDLTKDAWGAVGSIFD